MLFFPAAGGEANRLAGLSVVIVAGALMYVTFHRFAPPRLTLVQAGLTILGWVAISYVTLFFFAAIIGLIS